MNSLESVFERVRLLEQCGSSLLNDLNKEFSVNSGRVLIDYFYKLKLSIVFDKKGRGLKWARSVDFFMQIPVLDSVTATCIICG